MLEVKLNTPASQLITTACQIPGNHRKEHKVECPIIHKIQRTNAKLSVIALTNQQVSSMTPLIYKIITDAYEEQSFKDIGNISNRAPNMNKKSPISIEWINVISTQGNDSPYPLQRTITNNMHQKHYWKRLRFFWLSYRRSSPTENRLLN